MKRNKRNALRWLLGVVIVAELAVVDYCVVMLLRNGLEVEVSEERVEESEIESVVVPNVDHLRRLIGEGE